MNTYLHTLIQTYTNFHKKTKTHTERNSKKKSEEDVNKNEIMLCNALLKLNFLVENIILLNLNLNLNHLRQKRFIEDSDMMSR